MLLATVDLYINRVEAIGGVDDRDLIVLLLVHGQLRRILFLNAMLEQ